MAFGFGGTVAARTTAVYEADIRPLKAASKEAQTEVHRGARAMDKDLADLDSRWDRLGKAAGLTGKALTAGLAVAGPAVAAGLAVAVKAASNLEEQLNKNKVVFGEASREVIAFSETTASALGISQRATLEATGTFGNMLVPMGFAREEAAQMSVRMVQLAADLASFNNASPEKTLEALRSGLAGETEPLRQFGVNLNDARLKQEALSQGLWDGKGALDANAKAAATYALILKDTKDAQGDAAATADTLAGQERRLKAQLEDLTAQLGQALLPTVTAVISEFTEFVTELQESGKASEIANGLLDGLRSTIDALEPPARAAAKALELIADAVGGWDNAFQLLLTGLLVKKALDLAGALRGVQTASSTLVVKETAEGLTVIGTNADDAKRKVGGLRTSLANLAKIGTVAIGIQLLLEWDFAGDVGGSALGAAQQLKNLLTGGDVDWSLLLTGDQGIIGGRFAPKPRTPWVGDPRNASGQAVPSGPGPNFIYPKGTPFSVGGGPGQGTHAASDWQSGNAVDVFADPGTPVLSPVDGTVIKVSGDDPSLGTKAVGNKRIYGYGVTIAGFSGLTFYLAHLDSVSVKAGDRVSRGQVIGVVASWKGGKPHVHVGVPWGSDPRAITLMGQGTLGDYKTGAGARSGGGSGGGGGGADDDRKRDDRETASTITYAAVSEVKEVASKVRYAYSRLDEIPEDAAKRLRPKLKELARILGKPVTPETLAEVEKHAQLYMRQVGRILEADRLEEKWKGQRAQLQRLLALDVFPPEQEAKIRKQVAAMDAAVAAAAKAVVPTPAQLALIKKGQATLAEVIEEGIENAREAVDAARDKFDAAWSRFTDHALAAFDAETQKLLAGMRVKVKSVVDGVMKEWEFGEGFKTPSEVILEAEESQRAKDAHDKTMAAAKKRVEDANAAVLAAQAEGGEKLAEAKAEQAAAQAALEDLLWEERRTALQLAAEEERRIAEGRLTQAQQTEEARRNVLRGEFQAELVELGVQIATRGLTYSQAMGELEKLFAKYEVPFEQRGSALSQALAIGMNAALGAVRTAVNSLVKAVQDLNAALGVGVEETKRKMGELEQWERALQARSQALNEKYGLGSGAPGSPSGGLGGGGGGGGLLKPMAEGYEVTRPTAALVGEAGREWVVPEGKIPPHLRPMLIPLLRRIIRSNKRPHRDPSGLLHLAEGGIFGRDPVHGRFPGGFGGDLHAEQQAALMAAIAETYSGNLYTTRAQALRAGRDPVYDPDGGNVFNFSFLHQPADPWVYFEKARETVRGGRGRSA
jgi:murein DD-endopeptidase MepM/ murein hydrolase activator NlpD